MSLLIKSLIKAIAYRMNMTIFIYLMSGSYSNLNGIGTVMLKLLARSASGGDGYGTALSIISKACLSSTS